MSEFNISFKDFLAEDRRLRRLDEGLQSIKDKVWPNMSLPTTFAALAFSPDWQSRVMKGNVQLEIDARRTKTFEMAVKRLYADGIRRPALRRFKSQAAAAGGNDIRLPIPGAPDDKKQANAYCSQFFGALQGFLGAAGTALKQEGV